MVVNGDLVLLQHRALGREDTQPLTTTFMMEFFTALLATNPLHRLQLMMDGEMDLPLSHRLRVQDILRHQRLRRLQDLRLSQCQLLRRLQGHLLAMSMQEGWI